MSFERALRQLQSAILEVEAAAEENELTLKEEGMIQRFEYCFELGWKLMKDLAWEGASQQVKSPKGAIAWHLETDWLKMLRFGGTCCRVET